MNTYNKERRELVEKVLAMIAAENNWKVKEVITYDGFYRTIYKIPPHEQVKV